MKVAVTHLKAPWPAGAVVGSIVELPGPLVPGWARGKCEPAADDAEAEFTWTPPAPVEPEFVVNPAAEADEKARAAEAMLQAAEQEIAQLQGQVASLTGAIEANAQDVRALTSERDAARAQVEALTAALADAQKPAADGKAAKSTKAGA